ncbi:MAG TPA: hypothetical protein VGD78_04425 [Chthoniobacterales bacterium]
MATPEDENEQTPSFNEFHLGQKPGAESPEHVGRAREGERKESESSDLGEAAEESKRDSSW